MVEVNPVAKYKDEEIMESLGGCLYEGIPVASLVLAHTILEGFVYWPLALSLSVMIFGLTGYWIPERSKRRFLEVMGIFVLLSLACFVLAHLAVILGWIDVSRA